MLQRVDTIVGRYPDSEVPNPGAHPPAPGPECDNVTRESRVGHACGPSSSRGSTGADADAGADAGTSAGPGP